MFRLLTLSPIIVLSLAIIVFSSFPRAPLPDVGILEFDKVVHLTAFLVYGVLLQFALIGNTKLSKSKVLIATLIIGIVFAISDELHQSFVPGRDADIFDLFADTAGILISLLMHRYLSVILKIKKAISI